MSVGDESRDATRCVANVSAGRVDADSTDAVNGSQLYGTNSTLTSLTGNIHQLSADISALNEKSSEIYDRIEGTSTETNAYIAGAMAIRGMPQAFVSGQDMLC